MPLDPAQRLLKQIGHIVKDTVSNDTDVQKIQVLLGQLKELIANSEQQYKRRMKNMKEIQDNAFAELFLEKNEQITKLQLDVEVLKRENAKGTEKMKSSDELMAAKNEICRLKEILSIRNTEMNQLTYKLVDAQSYIESLEKEKYGNIKINAGDREEIINHFKTLKKALLSNRTLLKMMQSKTFQHLVQNDF